jgi:hypothetical protein
MKLYVYIHTYIYIYMKHLMVTEPISAAYFINPSRQFLSLYVYHLIVIRERLGIKGIRQMIHIQQQKNFGKRHFLCGPCRMKEKYSSPIDL